jgi:heterodisulfide reductase subunit A-like polyferredoxin
MNGGEHVKKINFLGHMVNVVDDEEIERAQESGEKSVYVVTRIVDSDPANFSRQLRARSTRTPCEGCREICWFDPVSYQQVAILMPDIVCTRCMITRVKAERAAVSPSDSGAQDPT